jgi:hypothetical protein
MGRWSVERVALSDDVIRHRAAKPGKLWKGDFTGNCSYDFLSGAYHGLHHADEVEGVDQHFLAVGQPLLKRCGRIAVR